MKFPYFFPTLISFFLLGVFIAGCTNLSGEVNIKDLLDPDNQGKYNSKEVTVRGTVTDIGDNCMFGSLIESNRANNYKIADDTSEISIFSFECQPQLHSGDHVKIVGQFLSGSGSGGYCFPSQFVHCGGSFEYHVIVEKNRTIL
jgi:hypothetical protein